MCKYCEETSCISVAEYKMNDEKWDYALARVRLDIRPEDDLFQIDCEALVVDKKGDPYGEWSTCDVLDINYCPMCGKKLRKRLIDIT